MEDGEERQGPEESAEQGEGFDDLFEDLDRFFSPDPAEARRRREGEPPSGGPEDRTEPVEESVGDEAAPSDPVEEAAPPDDVLPPEAGPDMTYLETGEETPPESTAEMTGEEWSRLRDVLGQEEDQGEALAQPGSPEVSGDESMFGYEDDERESQPDWLEPGSGQEITLDDMKKAPREYEDLPGPSEAEEAAAAAAWAVGASDGTDWHEPETEGAGRPEHPGAAPGEFEWTEPSIADVEAAADQLAEDFRDAEVPAEEVEADLLADIEEPSGPRTVRVGAAETLTGPTWEEPTSQPLMAETGPPAGGAPAAGGPSRNMVAAVGTAAGLALVAIITLVIAKWLFVVVAGAVIILGQFELYATMQRKGYRPATALGLVVGAFVLTGAYAKGEAAVAFFVALGLLLTFLWYMAAPLKARENLTRDIGSTMLGILYVPVLAGYAFMLLAQPNSGRALMLTVIGLVFVYDIAAYFFGSFWGSRPLAPTISPRKSWEGLFGATVVTFALAIVLVPTAVSYLTLTKALGLALVIIVFAPLGDLVESLIKRDLGVKDMGSLLPGHGGVLDRIDSALLVAPAAFYYIRLIF